MRKLKITKKIDNTNSSIIDAVKANNEIILKHLYTTNYPKIELLVLKNSGNKEQAKDVYQDAFIAFWNNIKDNKFEPKSDTAIHGYLYTIAKNKWMDYLRSKTYKKTTLTSDETQFDVLDTSSNKISDDKTNDERLYSVMQSFKDLGLPCKTLLTKFYFEKKSMKEISEELELDAASTRNKKYRCMQKLRELALKID